MWWWIAAMQPGKLPAVAQGEHLFPDDEMGPRCTIIPSINADGNSEAALPKSLKLAAWKGRQVRAREIYDVRISMSDSSLDPWRRVRTITSIEVISRLRSLSLIGVYVGIGLHRNPSRHWFLMLPSVRAMKCHWKAGIPTERATIARCVGLASRPSILEYFMSLTASTTDFIGPILHLSCTTTFNFWALPRPESYQRGDGWSGSFKPMLWSLL